MVRMHAGRGIQSLRMGSGESKRCLRFLDGRAGDDDLRHPGLPGTAQDRVEIVAKGRMSQVCADVDERHLRNIAATIQSLGEP